MDGDSHTDSVPGENDHDPHCHHSRTNHSARSPEKSDPPPDDPQDDRVVIVKIGGSSITHKAHEETLNHESLEWFAALIASSVHESFLAPTPTTASQSDDGPIKPKFVIVHGAGSFGHHSAKRFGLQCGKAAYLAEIDGQSTDTDTDTDERRRQMEALSKTRRSVQKLNAAVVDRLVERGVNAVGISPGMTFPDLRAHGIASSAAEAPCDSDPRFDPRDGDEGGDEDGDADGKCLSLNVGGSSHAHDVTGGLKAKLGAAVAVVQAGIDVIIAQCGSVSAEKFVKGEYESVYEVEEGTLLTTVARSKLKERVVEKNDLLVLML
ncbi:hypothetical protein ACHAXS_007434 [Conticribra weissflogii]